MKKKILPLSKVYQYIEPGPVIMVTTVYRGKPNIMTMSWHMMLEFEPPLIALVVSDLNYSFTGLMKTKECVINIPTVARAASVIGVGNCSGERIDKFEKFDLTPVPACVVAPPLIDECYVNLECRVVDTTMVKKYGIFVVEVVKAWITTSKKEQHTVHHRGHGLLVVDGKTIKFRSPKSK